MSNDLVLGALSGGTAAFVWSAISWMALPWHHATFRSFSDEDALVRAIEAHAPSSGMYGIPGPPRAPKNASREEREAVETAAWQRMQSGPIVTAVVVRRGFG